jgi:membrane protein implicated in regulation of membrane protease activity
MIPPWLIWFLLGIGLAFLELFLPGFIVLFFGIGCWATAGALLLWDISITQQILLFITASVVSLLFLRKWLQRVFLGASSVNPDAGFDDFPSGQHVPVLKTITPFDHGRIQYRGTTWYATAEETIEAGNTVEIIKYADNSRQIFFVQKINPSSRSLS